MFVYNKMTKGDLGMYDYNLLEERDILCIDQKSFLLVYHVSKRD